MNLSISAFLSLPLAAMLGIGSSGDVHAETACGPMYQSVLTANHTNDVSKARRKLMLCLAREQYASQAGTRLNVPPNHTALFSITAELDPRLFGAAVPKSKVEGMAASGQYSVAGFGLSTNTGCSCGQRRTGITVDIPKGTRKFEVPDVQFTYDSALLPQISSANQQAWESTIRNDLSAQFAKPLRAEKLPETLLGSQAARGGATLLSSDGNAMQYLAADGSLTCKCPKTFEVPRIKLPPSMKYEVEGLGARVQGTMSIDANGGLSDLQYQFVLDPQAGQ